MKRRVPRVNKKGSGILDIFYIGLFVMVFGIISFISYTVMVDLQPRLDAHSSSDVSKNVTAKGLAAIENLDYVIMMLIVGMLISTIIGAYFIDSHPILFVASLLLLILMLVVVPVFSNVFDKFSTHDSMSAAANTFDITVTFMNNWPIFFTVMGAIVLIALYAKHRTGGGAV